MYPVPGNVKKKLTIIKFDYHTNILIRKIPQYQVVNFDYLVVSLYSQSSSQKLDYEYIYYYIYIYYN